MKGKSRGKRGGVHFFSFLSFSVCRFNTGEGRKPLFFLVLGGVPLSLFSDL